MRRKKIFGVTGIIVLIFIFAWRTQALARRPKTAEEYEKRGIQLLLEGHVREAVAALEKAIALDPQEPTNYVNCAIGYKRLGAYDKAIAAYTKAIKLNPKTAFYYSGRGACYCRKGRNDKAIADFTRAIAHDGKNPDYYLNRGFSYLKKGDYTRAVADFSETIEKNPTRANTYFKRGLAYFYKGEYSKAVLDFTQVIIFEPGNASAFQNRGTSYLKRGDDARALADYTRAIQLKPDKADLYLLRGLMNERLGRYAKAVSDYAGFLKRKPDHAGGCNCLARFKATCPDISFRDGREAIRLALKAISLDKKADPHHINTLAAAYAEAGDFDRAVEAQRKAIALFKRRNAKPAVIADCEKRLRTYQAQHRWSSEQAHPEKIPPSRFVWPDKEYCSQVEDKLRFNFVIRSLYPLSYAEARDETGKTLDVLTPSRGVDFFLEETLTPFTYQGNLSRHAGSVRRYRLYARDTMDGESVSPFYVLKKKEDSVCRALEKSDQENRAMVDRALFICTRRIEHNPNDADAYKQRADVYVKKGMYDKAITDYTRSITLKPDYAAALRARVRIYLKQGKTDEALADLNRIIRLNPRDEKAYRERLKIFMGRSEYDKAAKDCEALIRLKPDNLEFREMLIGVYAKSKHYDRGIRRVTKWLDTETDNKRKFKYYCIRGLLFFLLGTKKKVNPAIADFTRALELMKKSGVKLDNPAKNYKKISKMQELYEIRAEAYRKLGDLSRAKADEKKAETLGDILAKWKRRELQMLHRRKRRALREKKKASNP